MTTDETHYEWKHCFTLPSDIPKKNKRWPKPYHPSPIDLSIDQCEIQDFNSVLLNEMHTWTQFLHLNDIEREILWLIELSHTFVAGNDARGRFKYIQSNMTKQLATFAQEKKVHSSNQLVKKYFKTIPPTSKVEFITKRKSAKKAILKTLTRLKALQNPTKVHISCVRSRWLRFRYHNSERNPALEHGDIKRGDYVYVMDFESLIRCFKGKVLGKKIRNGRVAFYSLLMENYVVERVHEDSIMTKMQVEDLVTSSDVIVTAEG